MRTSFASAGKGSSPRRRRPDPNAGNNASSGTELNDNRRVDLRVTYTSAPQAVPQPPQTVTKKSTKTTTTPGSPGSEGSVAVAAAIAVNVPESFTAASIGGAVVVAQGAVTVRGRANSSDLALADGSATNAPAGNVTVGAAVAINVGTTDNRATIAGATVTGDGVTVEAVMLDNTVGLTPSEPDTVVAADDTIFVGEQLGWKTGDEVAYDNGGGTSLGTSGGPLVSGGATKYYVINVGGGKIKLAASPANAQAGTALDLTTQGAGNATSSPAPAAGTSPSTPT